MNEVWNITGSHDNDMQIGIFLGVVGGFLVVIVLAILYLNKVACFKSCDGKTCFDVNKDPKKQKLEEETSTDDEE